MKMSEIMEKYNAGELTLEQANEELRAIGADISLNLRTEEELAAKKAREDAEGYFKPEDRGLTPKPKIILKRPDMKPRKDLAGTSEIQVTKQGRYEVFYNEDGMAYMAIRV